MHLPTVQASSTAKACSDVFKRSCWIHTWKDCCAQLCASWGGHDRGAAVVGWRWKHEGTRRKQKQQKQHKASRKPPMAVNTPIRMRFSKSAASLPERDAPTGVPCGDASGPTADPTAGGAGGCGGNAVGLGDDDGGAGEGLTTVSDGGNDGCGGSAGHANCQQQICLGDGA